MWLSCYIYSDDSLDKLLIEEVLPFVRSVLAKNLTSQFFFIRYSDHRGPHIRLRFKTEKEYIRTQLKPSVLTTFPSSMFVKYLPERERYGGKIGVEIAEQVFDASSTAVLAVMSENDEWNYRRTLGAALQLHLGMVKGLCMKRQEVVAFFDHIASHYHQNDPNKIVQLEQTLEPQKTILFPYLSQIWEQAGNFEASWLMAWHKSIQAVLLQLLQAQKKNQLQIPYSEAHTVNQLWYLYESYVHMTNNRLGVLRDDEPFLAYTIKRSLEKYE
ncbi:MAG: thiopeptide-type bacteriocin biosynthesis protein [Candidatus Levyibacteriota bacterium]